MTDSVNALNAANWGQSGVREGEAETEGLNPMKEQSPTESSLYLWRKRVGLTQKELANQAGVSQGHISEAESLQAELGDRLREFLEAAGHGAIDTIENHQKEMEARQEAIRRELKAAAPAQEGEQKQE